MPIYEYICNQCKRSFDYLLRNPNEEILCPYCQSKDLKRKFSTFSFGSKDSHGEFKSSVPSKCSGCSASSCSGCF